MSVTSLVLSHQVDRHAPRHGVIGYRSPKCPPGHFAFHVECTLLAAFSSPRRGTSQITHVIMVPREGTRRCIPLPCLRLACFMSPQTIELVTYSAGAPLYFRVPTYDITDHVDRYDWSCFTHSSGTGHADSVSQSVHEDVALSSLEGEPWLHD